MKYGKLLVSIAAAGLVAAISCTPAAAEDAGKDAPDYRGFYGGVGVGVGDYSDDGSEAAWRMDVWLRMCNWASLQFGYVDLGDPGSGDTDGVTYSIVPQLPLGERFTLHGKFGGMTQTGDNTSTDLLFGGGGSFSLPYGLGVRAEYEHYDFGNNVDAVFFSLYYKFGGL